LGLLSCCTIPCFVSNVHLTKSPNAKNKMRTSPNWLISKSLTSTINQK
jgi:hypothetical protein